MEATLREARALYFASVGFDERHYEARWQRFWLGPLPVRLPMTAGYRAALILHDLHHLLTGYRPDPVGEVELAAWELGSRCDRSSAAFRSARWGILALVALGSLIAPRRTHAAFLRGRSSHSLYGSRRAEALLAGTADPAYDLPLSAIRRELHLDHRPPPVTVRDQAAFASWWVASVVGAASFLAATPLLVLWSAIDGTTRP